MDVILDAIEKDPIGIKLLEKGKAEGKAEGEATAIALLWRTRFGEVPAEVTEAIAHATPDLMARVLQAFAQAPTEDEVRAILGL